MNERANYEFVTSAQVEPASAMSGVNDFLPHPLLRPGMAQTMLAAARPTSVDVVMRTEWPVLLDGGPDETGHDERVRLLAYYTPQRSGETGRGLVISLHGWEGCSHSVYNLVLAEALTAAGYDVLRLNVRDHGPGIHVDPYRLNRGLYLATLLNEVAYAVQQGALLANGAPVWLVGPSMGGNFALRIAAHQEQSPIPNLRRVVAVSPMINPAGATAMADANPVIHVYFHRLWSRSLRAKQACFPDLYDFTGALRLWSMREMTEWLVRYYTPFADAEEYFAGYAVDREMLANVRVPTSILTAADDPVIDAREFGMLRYGNAITVNVLSHGGHVGFVDLWPPQRRLPQLVLAELERA